MLHKKVRIAVLLLIIFLLPGCFGRQPLSRQEQIDSNNQRIAAAKMDYTGYSTEQIAEAVVKVLTLIDPPDAKFTHSTNRIVMSRFYTAFFVFNSVFGYDYWVVNFDEKENGVISVTVIVTGVQNMGMFATLPPQPALSNISVEDTLLSEAESKLFFKRVDYFLGKEKTWIDCNYAIQFAKTNNYKTNYHTDDGAVFGHFPYVCGDNHLGVEDQKPDYLTK